MLGAYYIIVIIIIIIIIIIVSIDIIINRFSSDKYLLKSLLIHG